MKIIRVFPRRTTFTPKDGYVFIGDPPQLPPPPIADEVHISVTFTWDIKRSLELKTHWEQYYPKVLIDGGAFNNPGNEFVPSLYIKDGVIFTSRGCNNSCPWCHVERREGNIRELPVIIGNVIQDNNLLQCNLSHIDKVFRMLKTQKQVVLSGGLESTLITDKIADELRGLSLRHIFLAADTKRALKPLELAVSKLKGIPRDKLRCYVMVGFKGENISDAKERLEAAWEIGTMPFIQLYQPEGMKIKYNQEWRDLAREWSRPAITKALHREELK